MVTTDTELLSAEDVAARMGVSVYTVWRWIKAGELRAFKPGREYRVRGTDLERFMRAREVRPAAPKTEASPSGEAVNEAQAAQPEGTVTRLYRLKGEVSERTRRGTDDVTVTRAGFEEILDDLEHGRTETAIAKLRDLMTA